MNKLFVLIFLSSALYASDIKNLIIEQDSIDFNAIEPLTYSTYKELIANQEHQKLSCIVARVMTNNGHQYFSADLFNKFLFSDDLYPIGQDPALPKRVFLNPITHAPILHEINYFALDKNGGSYLGNESDLQAQTTRGEFLRLMLDANYNTNPLLQAQAQFNLGVHYQTGDSCPLDLNKAHAWYEKAANQTQAPFVQAQALYTLGTLAYANKDAQKAFTHYQQATRYHDDHQSAMLSHLALAELYRFGKGTPTDFSQAEKHYLWVVEKNNYPEVQLRAHAGLGELYRIGGFGIEKNYTKALEQYQYLTACSDCTLRTIAHHGLGSVYHEGGCGVHCDMKKATEHFLQAAQQQDNAQIQAIAQLQLGDIYQDGGTGMEPQPARAAQWYTKAMNQTAHKSSHDRAHVGLAQLYQSGYGYCKDGVCTRDLYQKVANCCDSCAFGDACNGLGELYTTGGYGIEKNMNQAIAWYTKTLSQAHDATCKAQACIELAHLYRNGIDGIGKNIAKAEQFYAQAAAQSVEPQISLEAQEALGSIYRFGEGDVQKNLSKAIDCYSAIIQQANNEVIKHRAKTALQDLRDKAQLLMRKTDGLLNNVH